MSGRFAVACYRPLCAGALHASPVCCLQAANRLFGNFGELLDLHQSHRLYDRPGAGDQEEDEELEEEPEEGLGPEDEEELERRRAEKEERKEAKRREKLLSQVGPCAGRLLGAGRA